MFEEGQIFIDDYPKEAADWCNESGRYIDEMEEQDGHRRFIIKAVPEPTEEEIRAAKVREATSAEARISALEDALAEMMGGM